MKTMILGKFHLASACSQYITVSNPRIIVSSLNFTHGDEVHAIYFASSSQEVDFKCIFANATKIICNARPKFRDRQYAPRTSDSCLVLVEMRQEDDRWQVTLVLVSDTKFQTMRV